MIRQFSVLFFCVFNVLFCSAQEPQGSLRQFEGKILILRHPLQSNTQQYDAEGKLLANSDEGSWTVYGGILIDHVALTADTLSFAGKRILFQFVDQQFAPLEFKVQDGRVKPPLQASIKVEIKLNQPLESGAQLRALTGRIFALNTAELLDSLPDFWRTYLAGSLSYDPAQPREAEFSWNSKVARDGARTVQTTWKDGGSLGTVFYEGQGTINPKAISTPQPPSTEIARYEQVRDFMMAALLVDKTGTVRQTHLIKPLGVGLDEVGLSKMLTWRFQPATHNGEAVAGELVMGVGFNYDLPAKPAALTASKAVVPPEIASSQASAASSRPDPDHSASTNPQPAISNTTAAATSLGSEPASLNHAKQPTAKSVGLSAGKLKKLVSMQYGSQILALRTVIPEEGEDYGPDGKPVKNAPTNHWMLYSGLIYTKKISVKNNDIEMQVIPVLQNGSPIGNPMKIRLHSGPQGYSAEEAQQLMDSLFIQDKPSLQRARPEYRRPTENEGPIMHVGENNTVAPRPTYTPEPEFSEQAKKAKYQGTAVLTVVVDKDGNISRIRSMRSLGMGLDAQAMKTVRTWRFLPAMRGDQPVAVEMNVEFSFNLY